MGKGEERTERKRRENMVSPDRSSHSLVWERGERIAKRKENVRGDREEGIERFASQVLFQKVCYKRFVSNDVLQKISQHNMISRISRVSPAASPAPRRISRGVSRSHASRSCARTDIPAPRASPKHTDFPHAAGVRRRFFIEN